MVVLRSLPILIGVFVLVCSSGARALSSNEGALLTSLVATSASRDPMFDVLTRDDVKNALAVEADKQSLGCEASSCLAELAGAMGARIVVYGSVGQLGDELLLTLNLFDSASGSSGGRRVARGANVTALSSEVEATTTDLLKGFVTQNSVAAGTRVKLLVLDLEVKDGPAPAAAPPPPPDGGFPLLTVAGASVAALGVVGVVVGAVFDSQAVDLDRQARLDGVTQKVADERFRASDAAGGTALTAYAIGAGVLLLGGGVAIAGLVLE